MGGSHLGQMFNWPGVASAIKIMVLQERALLIPHAAVKGMLRHGSRKSLLPPPPLVTGAHFILVAAEDGVGRLFPFPLPAPPPPTSSTGRSLLHDPARSSTTWLYELLVYGTVSQISASQRKQ